MDDKFNFLILIRDRKLTSREACREYERSSGMKLNPSYIDFISQIGSGRFIDDDSLLFSVSNLEDAAEITKSYSEVVIDDIDSFMNSELVSFKNEVIQVVVEKFIDEKITKLLREAKKDQIFCYNLSANDVYFSINTNPEILFCSAREGEIHYIPDGFLNPFRKVDNDGLVFDRHDDLSSCIYIYAEAKVKHFDLSISELVDFDKIIKEILQKTNTVKSIKVKRDAYGFRIFDIENFYELSVFHRNESTHFVGSYDPSNNPADFNIETFLHQTFSVVDVNSHPQFPLGETL